MDKGFLYTIKELFTRPGHSIREFVQGKRVKHFNYFTLLLIIITVTRFTSEFISSHDAEPLSNDLDGYSRVIEEYAKFIILSYIPFFALFSYLLFRKSKQNYSENLVLNMYLILGLLIIKTIFSIVLRPYFSGIVYCSVYGFMTLLEICYIFWFYYQYFLYDYDKLHLLLRSIVMVFIILFIIQIKNQIVHQIGSLIIPY